MTSFIINHREKKVLGNTQVAFTVGKWGMVEVVQVEVLCTVSGSYGQLDMDRFSKSALAGIEDICAEHYNERSTSKEYCNDDLPPSAA